MTTPNPTPKRSPFEVELGLVDERAGTFACGAEREMYRIAVGLRTELERLRARVAELEARAPRVCVCGHTRFFHTAPEPHSCFSLSGCSCAAYERRPAAQTPPSETEVERLRTFAGATTRRHEEIRARLAQVDIRDSAEAWDLGMAVLALLDGPIPRAADAPAAEAGDPR